MKIRFTQTGKIQKDEILEFKDYEKFALFGDNLPDMEFFYRWIGNKIANGDFGDNIIYDNDTSFQELKNDVPDDFRVKTYQGEGFYYNNPTNYEKVFGPGDIVFEYDVFRYELLTDN